MLGLLQCSVPPVLKAELLNCLAAFGKSPEIAASLWQSLEYTQVTLKNMTEDVELIILLLLNPESSTRNVYNITTDFILYVLSQLKLFFWFFCHRFSRLLELQDRDKQLESRWVNLFQLTC